ncbi:glutamine-rich protein 2-like isoform X2 [Strix aluco]|uniref:glutamine-rich protein 2-like isoform X2 n=1 Tax=Strix aluco TaxID=111821 RepID=UPI003DA3B1B7
MDAPHGASSALGLKGPGPQPAPRTSKGTSKGTPQTQPGSPGTQRAPVAPEKGAGASSDEAKTCDARATTLETQTGSPGIKTTTLGTESGAPDSQTSTPGAQPGASDTQSATPGVQPRIASTETVEALCQIGQLSHPCASLKEQVAQLEASKPDHAELEKLRLLFSEGDKESITSVLADLQGRVSSLQGLTSDLQGENGKIRQLEDAVGKLEVAGANWKGDVSDQITLQLGSTLQEMRYKLKELEEQQEMTKATLERLVAKTADELQEQLGEPRAMVASTGQEQAEAQAACPACSGDIRKQVGQLLQCYEKLQEVVDNFMSQQAVGKVVRRLPGRSQVRRCRHGGLGRLPAPPQLVVLRCNVEEPLTASQIGSYK